MKKAILSILILLGSFSFLSKAAIVDTLSTHSYVMDETIKAIVIIPEDYNNAQKYPVTYLLHGYGGSCKSWLGITPKIKDLSDQYQMIIVCPTGKNSWYWDSPVNPKSQFETYITKELIEQIDNTYSTIKSPSGRAITGLSMGGHGGLYLAFKHQDIFGAAGSMSGGVDIRPFPNNWEMKKQLGEYAQNPQIWNDHTVTNMLDLVAPNSLALIIDCGTEDFFYQVNVELHNKMMEKKIPHDFISRPGSHDSKYWANAIQYQLLYMNNFFKSKN